MKKTFNLVLFFCFLFLNINHAFAEDYPTYGQQHLEQILEKKRAVFRIFSVKRDNFCSGTGFLVSKEGLIVTNSHVVHDSTKIVVYILNRDASSAIEYSAKIVQDDEEKDLAVIRLDEKVEHLPEPFELSRNPARVLEEVVAIGFPSALDRPISVAADISGRAVSDSTFIENLDPNVTKGAVSKVGTWVVHDAKISLGNSGGPLVSLRTGKVVGINTAKTQGDTAFYMAIPAKVVTTLVNSLEFVSSYTQEQEEKAAMGDIEATIALASLLYSGEEQDKRDPQRALQLMTRAAEAGSKEAMCELGYMYSDATSIRPNVELAIKYLTLSDTLRAKLRLCEIYVDGVSGCDYKPDPVKGFNLIKNFAEASGNPTARLYLSQCYLHGKGTKKNVREAIAILRKLVREEEEKNGFMLPSYQYDLSLALIESPDKALIAEGVSLLQNLSSSKLDFIKGKACLLLGNMYLFGENVKKDYKLSAYYYHLGIEAKSSSCMASLGNAYLTGRGVELNPERGVSLILKAVEQGASEAAYGYIGSFLWKNKKGSEAIPFLQKAADAGNDIAACELAFLLYTGEAGVEIKRTEAVKILRRVANTSTNPASKKLANDLLRDLGVTRKKTSSTPKNKRKASPKPTYVPRAQPRPSSKRW